MYVFIENISEIMENHNIIIYIIIYGMIFLNFSVRWLLENARAVQLQWCFYKFNHTRLRRLVLVSVWILYTKEMGRWSTQRIFTIWQCSFQINCGRYIPVIYCWKYIFFILVKGMEKTEAESTDYNNVKFI